MKHLFLLSTFLVLSWLPMEASKNQSNSITWATDYQAAIADSKANSKPIILFFTGSDWCSWCIKLEKEVLDTQEFATLAGDKYIFVKVDTPFNNPLPKELTEQNTKLKKQYNVNSFPTVILIDSNEKQIGSTGYRQGGPKAYAAHLEQLIKEHSNYHSSLNDLGKKKLSGVELKKLYTQAKELGRVQDAAQIVDVGIECPDNLFFLVERYRQLAYEGTATEDIRLRILERDPSNQQFTHYQVAVIDFESVCNQMETDKVTPEMAVAPLVAYMDKFGPQDPENLWRLEMLVSQVYFDKGKLPEALKYAEASYHAAPLSAQNDIATAIASIKSRLEKN